MRIIAIDYGDRRTGIAVSDETATICGEAFTIDERDPKKVAVRISDIASDRNAAMLVLGYPKNMNGTLGPRAEKTEIFAKLLRDTTGLEVRLWDERCTTVDAHRILSDNGRSGKKRKQRIDAVAASLILEGFLGTLSSF